MSEEKLTVAELMARAAKEGHSTDAPRRRRRRSLEDGGISVAELTGSIPAVKEKPAESKHSAVKIDDPVGAALIDDSPTPQPAATPAAEQVPAQPAEPETPVVAAEKPLEVKPEAKPVAKPSTPRTAPSNDETMVLSIVDEKDPIRLTTGAFPVVPAAAVKPAAVRPDPATTKDAEAAANAEFSSSESIDVTAGFPADTTQLEAITGDMAVADGTDAGTDSDVEDTQNPGKMSVFSVILMAVVGVVLGAVIFLAFEMLWERLSNWLVALLAIAVTLGMVGVVHALRTSRDGFSMILAALVGLVMTFGPLLIVM